MPITFSPVSSDMDDTFHRGNLHLSGVGLHTVDFLAHFEVQVSTMNVNHLCIASRLEITKQFRQALERMSKFINVDLRYSGVDVSFTEIGRV